MMRKILLPALVLAGGLMAGCSSEEAAPAKGKGKVQVDLGADVNFSTTRAIDESAYNDITNYTVKLSNASTGATIHEALYSNWVLEYEVESGTQYKLEASYGQEMPASYDNLLCYGSETFTVQPGSTKRVSFQCKPQAAKVSVNYSEDFATYFQDCDVTVKTQYMESAWLLNRSTVGKDLFIKAGQNETVTLGFKVTDKDGNEVVANTTTKNVTVNPQTWLKVTVKPDVQEIEGGKFGINVVIDDSITEETVTIVLPNNVFN